jgi:hypothetical protein
MGQRRRIRWIAIFAAFPAYEVTGAGSHALRSQLSMQAINQMPDALKMLVESLSQNSLGSGLTTNR